MQVSGEVTKSNIISTIAALIGGTVVVLGTGLAYGTLRADEQNDENRIQSLELRLASMGTESSTTEHRFTVIESGLTEIQSALKRIEDTHK